MACVYRPKVYKDGKVIRKGKFFWAKIYSHGEKEIFNTKQTNKRSAEVVANAKEQKFLAGELDLPSKFSGKKFEEAFLKFLEITKTDKAYKHYKNQLKLFYKNFLPFFSASKNIKNIHSEDIVEYLELRRATGISESTHNRELASLKAFFKYAKSKGWIKRTPTADIKQLKENQKQREQYTLEEAKLILAVDHPKNIFFWIMFYGGLRPTEAIGLKWENINFQRGVLIVASTDERPTKSKKTREIPLHTDLKKKLLETKRHSECPYILFTQYGKQYRDESYRDFAIRIAQLAEVPYKGSNAMRHTYGYLFSQFWPSLAQITAMDGACQHSNNHAICESCQRYRSGSFTPIPPKNRTP